MVRYYAYSRTQQTLPTHLREGTVSNRHHVIYQLTNWLIPMLIYGLLSHYRLLAYINPIKGRKSYHTILLCYPTCPANQSYTNPLKERLTTIIIITDFHLYTYQHDSSLMSLGPTHLREISPQPGNPLKGVT